MQLQTPMKTIENLQRCIKDSNHIVAILGIEMLVESGGRNFDSNEESIVWKKNMVPARKNY